MFKAFFDTGSELVVINKQVIPQKKSFSDHFI